MKTELIQPAATLAAAFIQREKSKQYDDEELIKQFLRCYRLLDDAQKKESATQPQAL